MMKKQLYIRIHTDKANRKTHSAHQTRKRAEEETVEKNALFASIITEIGASKCI
jgi:hypothetical protein